jgi:two-component system response regulator YesN
MENYLCILFAKMFRQAERALEPALDGNVWQGLREYIASHLDEELSLTALAQKSFYNPSYFSRVFKQRFGRSPSEYVRHARIERAMQLLASTERSVDDIMVEVGYTDRSAFYHAFAKETATTPIEYRARLGVK